MCFFFLFHFIHKFLGLFFINVGSLFYQLFFLINLCCSLCYFLLNIFLHLFHFIFVVNVHNLFDDVFSLFIYMSFFVETCTSKLFKLFSKSWDLIVKLSDHGIFGVFIDFWFILNSFCSVSISKRTDSFVCIIVGWAQVSNHDSFCITTKRILQDSSKFWIPVWNIGTLRIN